MRNTRNIKILTWGAVEFVDQQKQERSNQDTIKRAIAYLTKKQIDNRLRTEFAIDIRDYEGNHWTKTEGMNMLAYSILTN